MRTGIRWDVPWLLQGKPLTGRVLAGKPGVMKTGVDASQAATSRKALGIGSGRTMARTGLRMMPTFPSRGVQKQIAEILAQIHGDAQLESAGLNGQLGDQCCR